MIIKVACKIIIIISSKTKMIKKGIRKITQLTHLRNTKTINKCKIIITQG